MSTIGADGTMFDLGAGRTSTCGVGPGGNQSTRTGSGNDSHVRGEPATLARPEPEAEEDQIDLEGRAVLERDQCLGNPGPGIEGEREPPERLARRRLFSTRMGHFSAR